MLSNSPETNNERVEKVGLSPDQKSEVLTNKIVSATETVPSGIRNLSLDEGFKEITSEAIRESLTGNEASEEDFLKSLSTSIAGKMQLSHLDVTSSESGENIPLGLSDSTDSLQITHLDVTSSEGGSEIPLGNRPNNPTSSDGAGMHLG